MLVPSHVNFTSLHICLSVLILSLAHCDSVQSYCSLNNLDFSLRSCKWHRCPHLFFLQTVSQLIPNLSNLCTSHSVFASLLIYIFSPAFPPFLFSLMAFSAIHPFPCHSSLSAFKGSFSVPTMISQLRRKGSIAM